MPLPYDATMKDLAQVSPRGLLAAFDAPTSLPVSLLNVDLSTVTTAADLVFGLGEPLQEIVHLDFQSSASASKHRDIMVYNALLHRQFAVPVHSTIVMLRPQAAHTNLDGIVAYAPRPLRGKMEFGYEVVRLWERPATDFLQGDVGVAPLALLGKLPAEVTVSDIVAQLIDRLNQAASIDQQRRLLTASFILAGLRLPLESAEELFKGAGAMRDSVTYMAIVEEGVEKGIEKGRTDEARRILFRFGRKAFGPPGKKVITALNKITERRRLERLLERVNDAGSWKELLAE